jgi:hypothetical protein
MAEVILSNTGDRGYELDSADGPGLVADFSVVPKSFPAKLCMLTMASNVISLNVIAYVNIAGLAPTDSITKCGVALRYAAIIILSTMAINWVLKRLLMPYCWQREALTLSLSMKSVVDEESTLDQRFARHKWTTAMKQTVLFRKTAFVAILLAVVGTTVGSTMSIVSIKAYSELVAKDLVQVSLLVCFSP